MFRNALKYLVILTMISPMGACSLGSYPTAPAGIGLLSGGLLGAGAGHLLGRRIGNSTKNTALVGGIGAATGLIVGAAIHEQRQQLAKEQEAVIREARRIDSRQREIDAIRKDVYSRSSWGRLEVKPWHERYITEASEEPYQGHIYSHP
jgi:outer membrane lipoprotein SlyB